MKKTKILSLILAIAIILPSFTGIPSPFADIFKNLFTVSTNAAISESDWIADPYTSEKSKGYDYTFAVVGDTQTLLWNDLYLDTNNTSTMYDWIVNEANGGNIDLVMGLGDISETNNACKDYYPIIKNADGTKSFDLTADKIDYVEENLKENEYSSIKPNIDKLAKNNIPYTIIRGNHDKPSNVHSSEYTFDEYFKYDEFAANNLKLKNVSEVGRYDGKYEDGTIYNTYLKIEIQGNKYLILNLDCGISSNQAKAEDILEWANRVVSSNQDHQVIITTHMYLGKNGDFLELEEAKKGQTRYYGLYNSGEIIWNKLVRKHENIIMVLSGHVSSEDIGFSQVTGDHGNLISQFMIDPQGMDSTTGGVGMVALLHFSNDNNLVDVEYVSTVRADEDINSHFRDTNQFSFNLTAETDANDFTVSNSTITGYTGKSDTLYIPSKINGTTITAIGEKAFDGSKSGTYNTFKILVLPDTITSIEPYAFNLCKNLNSVTLPNSLTILKHHAFSQCSSLKRIAISKSVQTIERYAFWKCSTITDICLPVSLNNINYAAFSCGKLSHVWYEGSQSYKTNNLTIDYKTVNSVNNERLYEDISTWNFNVNYCPKSPTFEHFYFGACDAECTYCGETQVTTIAHTYGGDCDTQCDVCYLTRNTATQHKYNNVCDIECSVCHTFNSEHTAHNYTDKYDTICNSCEATRTPIPQEASTSGDFKYTVINGEVTISKYTGSETSVQVPEKIDNYSVTAIGSYAFSGNTIIKSVTLPTSLKSIGIYAFSGCTALKTLPIGNTHTNLETIHAYAFQGCKQISTITIPENVHYIGESAFDTCLSTTAGTVYIPASVTVIGYHAFQYTRFCTSYEVENTNTKYHSTNNCLIETETKTLLQAPNLDTVNIPYDGSVEIIGEYAFYYRTNLRTLNLPNTVKQINRYAFYGCSTHYNVYFEGSDQNEIFFDGNGHDNKTNGGILLPEFATWSCNRCMKNNGGAHVYDYNCSELCSKCGRSNPSSIDHGYGNWKTYNGITYKECSVCGNKLEFKFSSASLTLEANLTMNYKVDKKLFDDGTYSDPYVKFTFDQKTTTAQGEIVGNYYVFKLNDIAPHMMKESIEAELYAKKDNKDTLLSTKTDYSASVYCTTLLDKYPSNGKLRTLLVDLMNYGSELQKYSNYNINDLTNNDLNETQTTWGTDTDDTLYNALAQIKNTNATVKWTGAGLKLDNSVTMRFTFKTDNVEGWKVKITDGTTTLAVISPTDEQFKSNGNVHYVYYNDLKANEMSKVVYVTILDGNGQEISNTLRYSIESYAYYYQNDAKSSALLKAMMRYGKSAEAYSPAN